MKSDVQFVLENASWPALLVDANGVVRGANSTAVATFGAVVQSQSVLLSSIWGSDSPEPVEGFLTRWERMGWGTLTLSFKVKGGGTVHYLTSICPFNRDGQKFFVFQLLRDSAPSSDPSAPAATSSHLEGKTAGKPPVSEVGLAHKQKLDCALQLARTVALDFNNALTSILGHTSLIISKMEPAHPWRSSLVEVEKSAAKAAEIANDLANFSRPEKDATAQTVGNVNVILQRAVQAFQTQNSRTITWTLQLEWKLYTVKFDEAKMQQAFVKILENAIDAVDPANRMDGRISIITRNQEVKEATRDRNVQLAPGLYVCVEVTDNGTGIEDDILARIFEPFFTTKNSAKHRGLGLAWVYGIVTNHGGGVAISSQKSMGTSVRVYLPARGKIVRENSFAPEDLGGNQTILMVDDEDLLLTMGQMILSSFGYQVLTANSGQKALQMVSNAKTPVDLVITDMVMPNMSGRELIEHLRALAPYVRIIRSSGYIRSAAQGEDEDDYLQKPFTSQQLLTKVKQALASEENSD